MVSHFPKFFVCKEYKPFLQKYQAGKAYWGEILFRYGKEERTFKRVNAVQIRFIGVFIVFDVFSHRQFKAVFNRSAAFGRQGLQFLEQFGRKRD